MGPLVPDRGICSCHAACGATPKAGSRSLATAHPRTSASHCRFNRSCWRLVVELATSHKRPRGTIHCSTRVRLLSGSLSTLPGVLFQVIFLSEVCGFAAARSSWTSQRLFVFFLSRHLWTLVSGSRCTTRRISTCVLVLALPGPDTMLGSALPWWVGIVSGRIRPSFHY